MKVLHITVKGTLDGNGHSQIKKRIESDLKDGLLITDDFIHAEVLEADIAEVAGDSHQSIQKLNI